MKKYALATLVALSVATAPAAHAGDACETVLCMFGKLKGGAGGECNGAIADYFNIIKYKKGKIKWSATSSARQSFLNSCPGADQGKTKEINNKFGKVLG